MYLFYSVGNYHTLVLFKLVLTVCIHVHYTETTCFAAQSHPVLNCMLRNIWSMHTVCFLLTKRICMYCSSEDCDIGLVS
jgi:hypothetical protein